MVLNNLEKILIPILIPIILIIFVIKYVNSGNDRSKSKGLQMWMYTRFLPGVLILLVILGVVYNIS